MADERRICFDRLLPQELNWPRQVVRSSGPDGGRLRAVILFKKLWINGSTLRIRFIDGTPAQQQIVREHAPKWTHHANLKFEFSTDSMQRFALPSIATTAPGPISARTVAISHKTSQQ